MEGVLDEKVEGVPDEEVEAAADEEVEGVSEMRRWKAIPDEKVEECSR